MLTTLFRALITFAVTSNAAMATQDEHQDTRPEFQIDAAVLSTFTSPFIRHEQDVPFGSYLAMNVPFEPVHSLFETLQTAVGRSLITRGEAHVTVITPVEFDVALKSHISIETIHEIAEASDIQAAPISLVCLGRGDIDADGELLSTYFVVVDSVSLLEVRRSIHRAFVSAGGSPEAFAPEKFHPHITVGYTKRDLHLADGIQKDRSSCFADLVTR